MVAAHAFEEHTGEVRVRVEAADWGALLAEAALALAELLVDEPGPADGPTVRVEVEAPDREALLVDWLNELVFRSEVDKRVFTEFAFDEVTDRRVCARIRGTAVRALRTPVKAATFHELRVERHGEGLRARIVLDV